MYTNKPYIYLKINAFLHLNFITFYSYVYSAEQKLHNSTYAQTRHTLAMAPASINRIRCVVLTGLFSFTTINILHGYTVHQWYKRLYCLHLFECISWTKKHLITMNTVASRLKKLLVLSLLLWLWCT